MLGLGEGCVSFYFFLVFCGGDGIVFFRGREGFFLGGNVYLFRKYWGCSGFVLNRFFGEGFFS